MQAGEYLKAAALYTKAIKAEPDNHVYYSNRSNAFLKLSKVQKALEDADKCIELAPVFVKGYHRKASALHAGERSDEACEVLLGAIEKGLDNNDLVRMGITIKGKAFVPLAAARKPGGPDLPKEPEKPKENVAPAPPKQKAEKPAAAAADPMGAAKKQHLYQLDPESFAGLMIQDVFKEVLEEAVPTIVYCSRRRPSRRLRRSPTAAVGIDKAFDSPQTLANCTDFLANHIRETGSQVDGGRAQEQDWHPCVWKGKAKGKWPCDEKKDGIPMQLEARGARAVFFTEINRTAAASAWARPTSLARSSLSSAPIPIECIDGGVTAEQGGRGMHASFCGGGRRPCGTGGTVFLAYLEHLGSRRSLRPGLCHSVVARAQGAARFACQIASRRPRPSVWSVALARSARSAAGLASVCLCAPHTRGLRRV